MFLNKLNRLSFLLRRTNRFSTKSEKTIDSVEGHRPPAYEESVHGKYAGVLFASASQENALHKVLKDMEYLQKICRESDEFRGFIANVSFKRT